MKNRPNTPNLDQLLLDGKVITIENNPVKNFPNMMAPVGFFPQNYFNKPDIVQGIVMSMVPDIPRDISCFCSFRPEGLILAIKLAEYLGKRFVALDHDTSPQKISGLREEHPLKGEKVVIITGFVSSGLNCYEKLNSVRIAGGECKHIFPLFHYGLHFKSRSLLSEVKIHNYVTMKSIAEQTGDESVIDWLNKNRGLLQPEFHFENEIVDN